MNESDSFVAEWLRREPAMEVARLFCAPGLRPTFLLWGGLLDAIIEATFELAEPSVSILKLEWWAQELAQRRPEDARHPLWRELQQRAPAVRGSPHWAAMASAARRTCLQDPAPVSDTVALLRAQEDLARALAQCEALLFDAAPDPGGVARHLAWRRLRHALRAGRPWPLFPLHLQARHQRSAPSDPFDPGARPMLADLAAELLRCDAATVGHGAFRRARSTLDQIELERMVHGDIAPAQASPGVVWRLWRSARRP